MYETQQKPQTALLVGVDTGDYDIDRSLEELEELARSAGAEVVGKATQKRPNFDPATCIGSGRLAQIGEFVSNGEIDMVIFDHELSPAQLRNLEDCLECAVLDRTMLILDIFAQRATSNEGRLQVELAQLKYRLPRLAGIGKSMSRLGGGIGTRGPGETKLESDKRHIRRRIEMLNEELEEMKQRRQRLRERRKKDDFTTVAIVGYTNVGKSTLLNKLTDSGVLAEDKLFATLDPTARALTLPSGKTVMLVDTVGLVSRLPHHLVEAFKSTLEEAANADLLLNVCDVSSPDFDQQLEVTKGLLKDLKADNIPTVTVLNKCDKLPEMPLVLDSRTAAISAKTGEGLEEMLVKIEKNLPETHRKATMLIPYSHTALVAEIRSTGKVMEEEFTEKGTRLTALIDMKLLHKVEQFIE
ncbi:MAG: GTPase HflX [Oscillospiraceae bacterium]|nr:GTPase HflX [Oscillospiraceae bacterium]